jgi:hypothetical protein
MRYLAGGVVGAMLATGLVVLGATLAHNDTPSQHVTLSGSDSPTTEATAATTRSSGEASETSTTIALSERVTNVETKLGQLDSRVTKIEQATTTTTLNPCTSSLEQPDSNGVCHSIYTTTTFDWAQRTDGWTGPQTCDPTCPPNPAATSTTTTTITRPDPRVLYDHHVMEGNPVYEKVYFHAEWPRPGLKVHFLFETSSGVAEYTATFPDAYAGSSSSSTYASLPFERNFSPKFRGITGWEWDGGSVTADPATTAEQ